MTNYLDDITIKLSKKLSSLTKVRHWLAKAFLGKRPLI